MNFKNKHVLILGAGREGKATLRYLLTFQPTVRITIADQVDVPVEAPTSVERRMGKDYPTDLKEFDVVVVSPGIFPRTPLLSTARSITTPTNLFMEDCVGTVIGVSGTKGKSTTSSLIHAMLCESKPETKLLGNIGKAALDVLLERNAEDDVFVFELSSYQTRLLTRGPQIAVVINLYPEHMDYHGSIEQYYHDKLQIAMTQGKGDHLVYNGLDGNLVSHLQTAPARHHVFPSSSGVHVEGGELCIGDVSVVSISEIPLLGGHNVMNVVAAATVADLLGVSHTQIARAIHTFHPLPHRLEEVGTFRSLRFVDDAISTTPESTIEAIKAIPNIGTIFLGGTDRGYDFTALSQTIQRHAIPNIVLFPDTGSRIRSAIERTGHAPEFFETTSMRKAVQFGLNASPRNSAVLLSTASPSYSLFMNYEDKGNQFQEAVQDLA